MLNNIVALLDSGVAASTNSYESIATVTVGAGGSSSISFSSIPSTYKHLQIRFIARLAGAASNQGVYAKFNSSNVNYWYNGGHVLYGTGTTAAAYAGWQGTTTAGGAVAQAPAASSTANVFDGGVIDILDYANTNKYKTVRTLEGYDANGSGEIHLFSFVWGDTSAINTITILPDSNFAQYSSFALYGVKG